MEPALDLLTLAGEDLDVGNRTDEDAFGRGFGGRTVGMRRRML